MAEDYTGWKLFDKVIIVAKRMYTYDYKTSTTHDTENVQGYLVDPSNKKQLENARRWGTTRAYEYFVDEKGNRSVKETHEYKPKEYTYNNDGFTLELHNSAGGSSQGGKLSFWNCWITAPDGKRFLIGIAADLLLDVLKSSTVVNGVVQDKLMFARCNGSVGMISKSMDSYKNAVNDMAIKKKMSRGKTSKHKIGHVYETTTERNIYAGKFYRWYEPIYSSSNYSSHYKKLIGFKKLAEPIEEVWFPYYIKNKNKISDYSMCLSECRSKAPTRKESDITVEIDATMKDICQSVVEKYIMVPYIKWKESNKSGYLYTNTNAVGISDSKEEYTIPDELRKALIDLGYKVED